MADGRQRSRGTQTSFPVNTEIRQSARSQQQNDESLECSCFEGRSEVQGEIKNAQILLDSLPEDKAIFTKDGTDSRDQAFLSSEYEYAGTRSSSEGPTGGTSHDLTPRPAQNDHSQPQDLRRLVYHDTAPTRQDSAYESTTGIVDEQMMIDVDTQAGNMRARERVAILRGRVLRTRGLLSDQRLQVQSLRARFRDSTAKLMRAIDELVARGDVQNLGGLAPFHEATRIDQDELGPAEDANDMLETRLNREEEELEEEEVHYYTHNKITLPSAIHDANLDKPMSPLIQPYRPDDPQSQDLDCQDPLVKEYFETLGNAERLKEEIDDLENEHYSLTEELTFRSRYKLSLSEGKTTFMFEYPDTYKQLNAQLLRLEDDLYDLRDICIERGLFGVSEHVYEPRDALVEEIYDSVYDADRLLPLKRAADQTPSFRPYEKNFDDKRDYVNTWLLECVQDSPVEASRLKACIVFEFLKKGKELEGEEWPLLVLSWWNKDGAGKAANQRHVLSTMDVLLGGNSNSREGSLDVDPGDGDKIEYDIMTSETGSDRTQKGIQGTTVTDLSSLDQHYEDQVLAVRSKISSAPQAYFQ